MQRQFGDFILSDPAQLRALPVGHGLEQFGGIGDHRRVGPVATGRGGGDNRGAHGEQIRRQPGLLVGLADGGLLGRFVAVAGAAGQTPRAALMTPRRPVLQQHGG